MPRCEGLPSEPCPLKKNDNTVVIGKGDLMLCSSFDAERRRLFDETVRQKSNKGATRSGSTSKASDRPASTSSDTAVAGGRDRRLVPDKKELPSTILSGPQHSDCSSSGIDKPACDDVFESTAVTGTDVITILDELLAYASHYASFYGVMADGCLCFYHG